MNPIRLVLDTNIVMDMLHFKNAHTTLLLDAIRCGSARCFSDSSCLAELERVTTYPEFRLTSDEQVELMRLYQSFVTVLEPLEPENFPLPRCRDKDDQKFLILAARCRADLLITRDKLLLRLARHRTMPPPFHILTAEAANNLLLLAAKHPAQLTGNLGNECVAGTVE